MSRRDVLGTLLPGFDGPVLPGWLRDLLVDGLAGVCLFGENIESPEQLRALTDDIRSANPVALIAIDEEGGDVTRLHTRTGSPFCGNAVLGRLDDVELTGAVARRVGAELRAMGVNLDFAPDVDINSNPDNPVIGVRSFGTDPALVARHSVAWTEGLQSCGVAASIKHFPGHGDTNQDSHLSLPIVDVSLEALTARELVPFVAAIEAGAATVMTSHILLPQVDAENPATFSAAILGGILRGSLGFAGVIVSDALDMTGASGEIGIPGAAVRALSAGCDLLCIGTKNTRGQMDDIVRSAESALSDGRLDAERLANAAERVRTMAGSLPPPWDDMPAKTYDEGPESKRVQEAFAVSESASAWRGRSADAVLLRVDTEANIAVGDSPWGPFGVDLGLDDDVIAVQEGNTTSADVIDASRPIIVVGRDNHRHPWVRALVDVLRSRHGAVLVVDMGWPDEGRRYAELATFGSSRLVGQALAEFLGLTTTAGDLR